MIFGTKQIDDALNLANVFIVTNFYTFTKDGILQTNR